MEKKGLKSSKEGNDFKIIISKKVNIVKNDNDYMKKSKLYSIVL